MGDARVAEMTKINLSLHTLGRCIAALSKRGKQQRGGAGADAANAAANAADRGAARPAADAAAAAGPDDL